MAAVPQPPASAVLLTCGDTARQRWSRAVGAAGRNAAAPQVVDVSDRPGRAEVDPLLDGPLGGDGARLVVAGTDADLAAVLVRLLRRERLDVTVALLPAPSSDAAGVWGIPDDPGAAVDLALGGRAAAVPLLRDDRGGVVAGAHRVGGFSGVVYCDEHEVLRGDAVGLVVRPDPEVGVAVTVSEGRRLGGLRRGRERSGRGRAATIGCRPAALTRDGVDEGRPLERRSWYRHTADWLLACDPELRH